MTVWFQRAGNLLTLALYKQPGSKRSEIVGLHGAALKIRLAAQPIDGRANDALLRFIAACFKVPLRNITLERGGQSRHKCVSVLDSTVAPESLLTHEMLKRE